MGYAQKDFYPTLLMASFAARDLNIRTSMEYQKLSRLDPMLPSSPRTVYSDWKSFKHFINLANNKSSPPLKMTFK